MKKCVNRRCQFNPHHSVPYFDKDFLLLLNFMVMVRYEVKEEKTAC